MRLGIRAKLLGAFALLALFTGVLGWYTVLTIERLNDGQRTTYGDVFGGTHLLAEWVDESWQARGDLVSALLADNSPEAVRALRERLAESDAKLAELTRQMDLADTDREDVATLAQLNAAWDDFTVLRDNVILAALERGDRATALQAYNTDGVRLGNRLNDTIDDFLAKKREIGSSLQAEAERSFEITRSIAIALSFTAAGLGLLIGVFLARSIAGPVAQLATAAKGLATGDVDQNIALSSSSTDEVGRLAEAFREMIAYQQSMARVAEAMARGDLTQDVRPTGPGDQLGNAFQDMISNLRALVGQLSEAVLRANQLAEVAEEREARMRAIMDSVADAIVIWDETGFVEGWNPTAERLFGYPAQEMVGRRASVLLAEDSASALTVGMHQEMAGRRRDGSVFPIDLAISEMRLGDRTFTIASARDITDRKRAEARFRALLESAPDAIVTANREGRIALVNTQAERLFGYDRSELLGQSIEVLLPERPRDHQPRALDVASARSWLGGMALELTARRKDGANFPVEIRLSPLEDEEGVLTTSVIRDVTDRKRAEEAQRFLAQASTLLAASLDYETTLASVARLARLAVPFLADASAVHVVNEADAVAHPLLAEPAAASLREKLGSLPDQVLQTGQPVLATASSGPAREVLRASGFTAVMLVPLVIRARTLGIMSFVAAESGREYTTADLSLAQELAHRCALAVENARLYREAQSAIRLRDEFFSVAAHELKTPVAALLAFTQFMLKRAERQGDLPPRQITEALEEVHWQSDRIARLVSQLLDTSRLDAGKLALHPQPTDLSDLLREAVHTARRGADRHTLVLRAEPDLWGLVDPVYFEQVITNLVDNAIKYSPDGGNVEVDFHRLDNTSLRLGVRDHGIGVPPEHRPHIFERFYQAHAGQHFAGVAGMGLGLYISRRIVEMHGGSIMLESPPDGGVRVIVTLPVAIDADAGLGKRAQRREEPLPLESQAS